MSVTYERSDVDIAKIRKVGIGLLVAVAAFCLITWFFLEGLIAKQQAESPRPHPMAASAGRTLPPLPRLQASPRDDLLALRAREQAELETYGWVDEQKGVVRIPIERAIEILGKRGLLSRPAPPGGQR